MFLDNNNDFDFPELNSPVPGHNIRVATTNNIWPLVIAAGITAVGGILAAKAQDKGSAAVGDGEILPNTVSGNEVSAQDFLFNVEAQQAMTDLTTQMNEWSGQDRDFFKNTFEPFQESLMQANQELLPSIVNNSTTALKQNMQDMFDSQVLKDAFRQSALESGVRVSEFSQKFADQIDKIPTAEQRIGQAVSGVEQRFGAAGAELKRTMGAKGLDVSEASVRAMMIGKAGAKAGATQQAGEAARREMLDATTQATGVFSTLQQSQTSQLTAERGLVQSGADLTPQVGGVKDLESVGAAGAIESQLTSQESAKQIGTTSETKEAEFTQKGIQVPKFFDKETGQVVDAAGGVSEIAPPPKTTIVYRNGPGGFNNGFSGPGVGTGVGSDSDATGGFGVGPEGMGPGGPGGQGGLGTGLGGAVGGTGESAGIGGSSGF